MPARSSYTSQTTEYDYGVTIAGGSAINSNDLLAMVKYPDPSSGQPSSSSGNQESYTDNRLRGTQTYQDPNGNVHTYAYDVLGRQPQAAVTTPGPGVDGSVRLRSVTYNALGLPYLYSSDSSPYGGSVVNQVEDVYNGLGQLTGEYQQDGGPVNTQTSPEVQ